MATPDIVVQIKGGTTKVVTSPTASVTRLVELGDVNTDNLADTEVLTYVQANGRFEFIAQAASSAIDTFARLQANNAFDKANGAYANANTAIYTAAQIRANISNTAPINYVPATGVISHALSGAVATTYGNSTFVATVTVDDKGHVTSVTNTAINFPPSGVTSVAGKTGAVLLDTYDISENLSSNLWFTAARVRANISNTSPINYAPATGVISHADSGVVATGHGDAATVPKIVVDVTGHVTSVVNTAIVIAASQITSGTLAVTRGGTGQTAITVNGSLLIGNTVSGGFDVNPITATSPVVVTNDKGSIALTHATSGVVATGHGDAATVPKFTVDDKGHVTAVTNTAIAIASAAVTESPGGPFFHTAARVRGNVSNTTPINYEPSTGVFSHADSGVVATGHGDGATVPKIVVDAKGHLTSVTNTAIAISAAAITSGTLAVARGGTGQTAITVNGSLLIGNTVSGGFDVNPLTQGTGILITNDKGSITIAATGGAGGNSFGIVEVAGQANVVADQANDTFVLVGGTGIVITTDAGTDTITIAATGGSAIDQYARDKANGAAQNAFVTLNVAGQSDIVADSNVDTLIIVGSGITILTNAGTDTLTIQHPASGVTASGYGDAATVPKIVVDANGHITSVVNTAIAISAAQITSGTLAVARGGTGQTAITVNGSLLIGNTVSGGFDVNPITATSPVVVTNDKGSISLTHATSGVVATGHGDAATVPKFVVDDKGHVTSVTNTAIAIFSAAVTESPGGPFFHTAARVRGNVTNTAPINYDATTGTFSHADSGAVASGYGDAATVPKVVVDAKGHVTSIVNTAIAISAAAITSGTLAVARGGTGQTAITVNGSLLIGNTVSGGFDVNAIAATAPIGIANGKGSITLSHDTSGVVATGHGDAATVPKFVVDDKGHVTSVTNTAIAITTSVITESAGGPFFHTAARVRGNVSNTTPINYDATTGIFSHALSGVVATGHGDGATVPKFTVDDKGHVTAVTNTAIAISASAITSGTLVVARGGTGQTAITVNGSLLIGNTVSGGFDVNPITATTPVVVTNDKGAIALTHATSGVVATGHGDAATVPKFVVDDKGHVTSVTNTAIAITSSVVTESAGGPFFHTAARVRGNVSNTTPINYEPSTGVFSHALSGVVATGHGDGATVPKIVVNDTGHITTVTNTAIAISASQVTSGTLAVARGGTGQTAITVNGSLLIGNTVSGGFDVNPITATTPVVVTNDKGSIALTHATSGVVATGHGDAATVPKFTVDDKGHVTSVTNTAIAITTSVITESAGGPFFHTAARVRGNVSNTAPINYDATTGIFSHALSGVVATGHGDAATVPKFTVDDKGHVTAVTNTAIAISATQVTSGTLAVARGGTGQTAITVNGCLLIGNTVSSGFDVNTLTAGTGILINNSKGSIEIVATGGSATDQFARDTANGAFTKANTARRSITVTAPVVTDNITFFFTDIPITFTKVVSVVRGTATPNVVFLLSYESSRHTGADRTNICDNITCANTTNGVFTTTFVNATVPANNYVTVTCSTVSGTVDELAITMMAG